MLDYNICTESNSRPNAAPVALQQFDLNMSIPNHFMSNLKTPNSNKWVYVLFQLDSLDSTIFNAGIQIRDEVFY